MECILRKVLHKYSLFIIIDQQLLGKINFSLNQRNEFGTLGHSFIRMYEVCAFKQKDLIAYEHCSLLYFNKPHVFDI